MEYGECARVEVGSLLRNIAVANVEDESEMYWDYGGYGYKETNSRD